MTVTMPRIEGANEHAIQIALLRNDRKFREGVERGLEARKKGKLIPWSEVKAELGIG